MVRFTGGKVVVRCLEEEDVQVIFGMPGINVLSLYDALRESSIRHFLIKNEQSAAFMADAYARVTGTTGVYVTTAGPGLTNTLTGLATAFSDSIPVIALAGEIPSNLIGKNKGVLHEINQTALSSPVTRTACHVRRWNDIRRVMWQAFENVRKGRNRPVYVGLPEDILDATGKINWRRQVPHGRRRSLTDDRLIRKATRLLSKSSFPVILAGGGVTSAEASAELVNMAELLSAPVVTTIMGAGSIPADNPLFLGRSRMRGLEEIFQKADVMLAVGTRFSSLSMKQWTLKVPKKLIHIDIDREMIGKNYTPKICIHGDAKSTLSQISRMLLAEPRKERQNWRTIWEGVKRSAWEALRRSNPTEVEAVMSIRNVLERDAIVAADTTLLSYWMQRILPVYEPRTFLYPFGYVAMGYALPAAIAAKIAFPKRQVIGVCGDGGFMVTCQELATAVENKLSITILLHNNRSYGILKSIQDSDFKGRHFAVDLSNPDFVKFAESFGAAALRVNSASEIAPCLKSVLGSDRPTIIEIQTPFAPPP